jgi:glycosyltransferase involved in cell wall biosynthesis
MSKDIKNDEMHQPIRNFMIRNFLSGYYSISEPLYLKLARLKFAKDYLEDEENPLVSVCIPTYNRGDILIQRSVSSVLDQSYQNFELIIIGDHCTDNTEHLLAELNDPRIRFYNLPVRKKRCPDVVEAHWLTGPVVAANKALGKVKGKWICRVDDDDTWTPDHIKKLLRFAQEGKYEFVSAQYEEERHGTRTIDKGVPARSPYYTQKEEVITGYNPLIGGVSTWFYRSYLSFIKFNIHCWRKKWNRVNDVDFSLRVFKAGVNMGFLTEVVSFVLPRPGEETIGFEAYTLSEKEKANHFKF